jgi:hypothetical protein
MVDMDQVTQSHSASSQESAALSHELANQAEVLNGHVDHLGQVINGSRSHGSSNGAGPEEPEQLTWEEEPNLDE